jgi:hypothetical protein
MIRRNGAQDWNNIHVTKRTALDDLIDIDNSTGNPQAPPFALLRQAATDLDRLIQQARAQGKRIRALGSGWALTDIAITDGWLVNTKLLNGCFDVASDLFETEYPETKRPYLVLAQCGISVNELNIFLEVTRTVGFGRALKTAGIGAGQTIGGATSGNTHGSAINFGAMPDFIVGLQVVTGNGKSLWIERASQPVLNDEFLNKIGAERLRDDDVLNAAIVSFGAFGIITAVAIETDPIYQLLFPPIKDITHTALKEKLNNFDFDNPKGLYHYEFVFDPYSKTQTAMEAPATRIPFEPGHPTPTPPWIVRSDKGFAPGDQAAGIFFNMPLLTPEQKTAIQFDQYRKKCILTDTRGTPGQLFTATITYLEGYTESAIGVSITAAAAMIDISTRVIADMQLPTMSQVRLVHPSRALLGFTQLTPKTAVFEFGLANDDSFPAFENNLTAALSKAGIAYTLHWSKNAGIDAKRLEHMYGTTRIATWRAARRRVFQNNAALMHVFDNDHLARAGLA